MKVRLSLFIKTIIWFLICLSIIGAIFLIAFDLQFKPDSESPLKTGASEKRIITLVKLTSQELAESPKENWDLVLEKYSKAYEVDFILASNSGKRIAGKNIEIPLVVKEEMLKKNLFFHNVKSSFPPDFRGKHRPPPPPPPRGFEGKHRPPPPPPPRGFEGKHRPPPPPVMNLPPLPNHIELFFTARTNSPLLFWGGIILPLMMHEESPGGPPTLLMASASFTGNGLFFEATPWLIIILIIIILSFLLWFPMMRSITRPLSKITTAAEQISECRFNVSLDDRRSDEIGRLAKAINMMSSRLDSMINGQKRFLGDIAHELASPIARIKLSLGILEHNLTEKDHRRLNDVADEVEHLSDLVNEMLSFSRAENGSAKIQLKNVNILEVIQKVIAREALEDIAIKIHVDENANATADPELLTRALANILRNAVRYAGEAGAIEISANRIGKEVIIEVLDSGPGVPNESLPHLFQPFYRTDTSRDAMTGGVGLGLAIVNTCITACQGKVSARNREQKGFAIAITLNAL